MKNKELNITLICCCVILIVGFLMGWVAKEEKEPQKEVIIQEIIPKTVIPFTPLGEHTLTWYCPTGNRTASMTEPKEGRTIAIDKSMGLKFGDTVYIEKYGAFVCEDTGSAIKGRKVDIYIEDCNQAKQNGVKKAKVYLIGE